jgi:hypothetical protein
MPSQGGERFRRDRLCDVAIELDAPAPHRRRAVAGARQRDESRSAQLSILAKAARQLEAVHDRHVEIDQDQMRPMEGGGAKSCLAGLRNRDPRAEPFKHLSGCVEHVEIVIHDQDCDPTKGESRRGGTVGIRHCPLPIEPMLGASCVERVSHCASARLVPVERVRLAGICPRRRAPTQAARGKST